MLLLFSLNLLFSIIFITLTHPMSMGLILLIQTTIISLLTGYFNMNFWYSYIIFLIMIGGMLIIFIYMTSVASNEKFNFSFKYMYIIFISMLMFTIIYNLILFKMNINFLNNEMLNFNKILLINIPMNKYINFPTNIILLWMITYLFIALIATIKISNINYGPLRQMN
uniref:NADH-ubiquinone oxidoreductase chain 6 n=1 Tax=Mikadonius gracilis TaxID=700435 RepID=A0A0S2MRB3_9CUCU|nr:NADH deshydrogenase subunit 6 [Mikadonius gracilis]